MLNVPREDQELPVAFFSSKIGEAQKNYSATELEAYGVLCAVKHWDYYLVNQSFTVVTDHRALCYLLTSNRLNNRLHNYALQLQKYSVKLEYRPGKFPANVDGLSRQAWEGVKDPPALGTTTESAEDQEDLPDKSKTRFKLKSKAVSTPLVVHPTQEGVGLAGEVWGWKPIKHFNILCFSVHCHAVITLSHELRVD